MAGIGTMPTRRVPLSPRATQRQVLCGAAQLVEDGDGARCKAPAPSTVGSTPWAITVEELDTQHRLQPGDGLGHGRLRQVQHGCGLVKAAMLEHGNEDPQLAHLQVSGQAVDQVVGRHAVPV